MDTEKIWSEFSEALSKFIFSKVKNEAATEDILQDVFVKIHLKKDDLKEEDRLKSWLFSIANNATLDYFRKNKTAPELTEATSNEGAEEPTSPHDAGSCLLPLILRLPKKYKEALLLTEIKGLKQAQAAEQLKISVTAAKSRIQRGRELLKQGFMDCCNYTLDENGHLKGEHQEKEDCKVCS